jgi:hypothetical protein
MTSMPTGDTDLKLQFARQLYEACRERHGEDHEQTRLFLRYLHSFENGTPSEAHEQVIDS